MSKKEEPGLDLILLYGAGAFGIGYAIGSLLESLFSRR